MIWGCFLGLSLGVVLSSGPGQRAHCPQHSQQQQVRWEAKLQLLQSTQQSPGETAMAPLEMGYDHVQGARQEGSWLPLLPTPIIALPKA